MVASTMDELPTIYLNGELYSGEIWSNDNRTICMEVRDGMAMVMVIILMNMATLSQKLNLIIDTPISDKLLIES